MQKLNLTVLYILISLQEVSGKTIIWDLGLGVMIGQEAIHYVEIPSIEKL